MSVPVSKLKVVLDNSGEKPTVIIDNNGTVTEKEFDTLDEATAYADKWWGKMYLPDQVSVKQFLETLRAGLELDSRMLSLVITEIEEYEQ